jgi:hypothetical protein
VALTLAEAQAIRSEALEQYMRALSSQSYDIGTRSLQRQALEKLWQAFVRADQAVEAIGSGRSAGVPTFRITPRDL